MIKKFTQQNLLTSSMDRLDLLMMTHQFLLHLNLNLLEFQ